MKFFGFKSKPAASTALINRDRIGRFATGAHQQSLDASGEYLGLTKAVTPIDAARAMEGSAEASLINAVRQNADLESIKECWTKLEVARRSSSAEKQALDEGPLGWIETEHANAGEVAYRAALRTGLDERPTLEDAEIDWVMAKEDTGWAQLAEEMVPKSAQTETFTGPPEKPTSPELKRAQYREIAAWCVRDDARYRTPEQRNATLEAEAVDDLRALTDELSIVHPECAYLEMESVGIPESMYTEMRVVGLLNAKGERIELAMNTAAGQRVDVLMHRVPVDNLPGMRNNGEDTRQLFTDRLMDPDYDDVKHRVNIKAFANYSSPL